MASCAWAKNCGLKGEKQLGCLTLTGSRGVSSKWCYKVRWTLAKKVSSNRKYFSAVSAGCKLLIKKVLTPPVVAVPDHPHQLPRSVQGKGTGPPGEFKAGFLRSAVALAVVAAIAAGHQIFPGRPPTTRTRHNVVQRQFRAGEYPPTKLAGIAVAKQNILAR